MHWVSFKKAYEFYLRLLKKYSLFTNSLVVLRSNLYIFNIAVLRLLFVLFLEISVIDLHSCLFNLKSVV